MRWLGQEPHCLRCIGLDMPRQCYNGGAAPFHASARLDATLPSLGLALLVVKGLEPCLEHATTMNPTLARHPLHRWQVLAKAKHGASVFVFKQNHKNLLCSSSGPHASPDRNLVRSRAKPTKHCPQVLGVGGRQGMDAAASLAQQTPH